MKILIISSWYPSTNNIISGAFVKEQALALIKVGIEPIIFYPYDKSLSKNKLICNVEDGLKTYRANTDYLKISMLSRVNSIFLAIKFLRNIVKKEQIDLIHSHVCYPSGFVAMINKEFYKIPYIITEHMSTIGDYNKKWYNRILLKKAYGSAENVITVSKFLSKELKSYGFVFKEAIIPNVVNINKEENMVLKAKNPNKFNILFIGGMDHTEVKGLNYLIPALSKFVKEYGEYSINVSLIGEGDKRADYEELCNKLGIEKICHFHNYVKRNEMFEFIKRSDFLVLPSIKETFGCVLIEAMSMGKPVLSTKCGGPEEIVNENTGILINPKDVDEIKNGILQMIYKYDKFDSIYIRNYAIENYSSEAIGTKLKKIYMNILDTLK